MSTRVAGNRPARGQVLGLSDGIAARTGLRRLRSGAGVDRADLAARLGWTAEMVARRETGAVRMTPAEAGAAAAALGTDLAGLLAAGREAGPA